MGCLCVSFPELCSIYFVFKNSAFLHQPIGYEPDLKQPSVALISSQQ